MVMNKWITNSLPFGTLRSLHREWRLWQKHGGIRVAKRSESSKDKYVNRLTYTHTHTLIHLKRVTTDLWPIGTCCYTSREIPFIPFDMPFRDQSDKGLTKGDAVWVTEQYSSPVVIATSKNVQRQMVSMMMERDDGRPDGWTEWSSKSHFLCTEREE